MDIRKMAEDVVEARLQNLRAERAAELPGHLEAIARGEMLPREVLDKGFPLNADTDCALRYMGAEELRQVALDRLMRFTKELKDAMALAETVEAICSRMELEEVDSLDALADHRP